MGLNDLINLYIYYDDMADSVKEIERFRQFSILRDACAREIENRYVEECDTRMNMYQAKREYRRSGGHFFDPETMCLFKSRIETPLVDDCLFVTSETDCFGINRLYTVRRFNVDYTDVLNVGTFQAYKTLAEAKWAMNVVSHFDEMIPSAGFRELDVMHNLDHIRRFCASGHDAWTLYSKDGNSCVYDFTKRRFVG